MESLRAYLFIVGCAILLLPGHNCCSPNVILETANVLINNYRECPDNKYMNVFTHSCTDFNRSIIEDQGDCPDLMHLKLIPDTNNTVSCVCNVRDLDVPLIYVAQRRQCYSLFEHGPCNDGDIITINGLRPGCVPDRCLEMDDSEGIVVFKEECYRLGGSCEESGQIGRIEFKAGFPVCYKSTSSKQCIRPDDGKCPTSTYFYYGQCLQESLEGLD